MPDHLDVFPAEFAAQFVEKERDGEPGTVAHEQAVVAVVDVAPRPGDQHAALVLQALALPVIAVLDDLAVGEPSSQHQQHRRDQRLKKQKPGVLRSIGFDDAHGEGRSADDGKTTMRPGPKTARAPAGAAGSVEPMVFLRQIDPTQFQCALLKRKEPRGNRQDEQL